MLEMNILPKMKVCLKKDVARAMTELREREITAAEELEKSND